MSVVGATGLGLVWGWLLARIPLRAATSAVAAAVTSLLLAAEAAALAGGAAAVAAGGGAAVGLLLHRAWLQGLRARADGGTA